MKTKKEPKLYAILNSSGDFAVMRYFKTMKAARKVLSNRFKNNANYEIYEVGNDNENDTQP